MKGFNKVVLMGNLTRDPDLRTTTSGQNVTNLSLAVSRSYKDSLGQQQEQTSFINCVAWGKVGEILAQYALKGSPLLVSGRLDQRTYEDKDGNKRQAMDVVVEDFNFIGKAVIGAISQHEVLDKVKDVVPDVDDKPIDLSAIPF